jgi:cyclase
MLKKRIIPVLLWNGSTLVKGQNFINKRKAGSAIATIKIYISRDVDEIFFFDISNTNSTSVDQDFIKSITDLVNVPITIGGGIKSIEQMDILFKSGADKICFNSSAFQNPELINEAAKKFGSQAITVSIDVKKIKGEYVCFKNNGNLNANKKFLPWLKECADRGAGEILINSIDHDGLMQGYDYELIKLAVKTSNVPIVANGGAGNYEHFYKAHLSGASAFAASSIYHFANFTPAEAKKYLTERKVNVRKNF